MEKPHQPSEIRSFKLNEHNNLVPNEQSEEAIELVRGITDRMRETVLEQFPSKNEGLNEDRISDFLQRYDVPSAPYTVIDQEDYPAFSALLEQFNIPVTPDNGGAALNYLGMGYVVRDTEMEEVHGPGFTESVIIHELAHLSGLEYLSTTEVNDDTQARQSLNHLRTGMGVFARTADGSATSVYNGFYEEAFAAYLEKQYAKDALGLPNGFGDAHIGTLGAGEEAVSISLAYGTKQANGLVGFRASDLALAGLETLSFDKPEIIELCLKARTDIDAKRQFAKVVNDIQPGLYQKLGKLPYDYHAFLEGYKIIHGLI